jgi:hypothetical protein
LLSAQPIKFLKYATLIINWPIKTLRETVPLLSDNERSGTGIHWIFLKESKKNFEDTKI